MLWRKAMIKQLRKKFIRIAMLAVTSVLLLLCIIVNLANFLSVNSQLNEMLSVINSNQGSLPPMPRGDKPPDGDKKPKQDGQFTQETAYSTRYFVLRFTSDGQLVRADLDKIAAVTQDDTDEYVQIALKHGEGFGYTSGYKYYVTGDGDGRYTAIFLDCYRDVRSMITLAVLSVAAMAISIALVYVIVVLFSRKAIDPVVKSAERQKQFITDASHELKTPITVIATSLKVLEMEVGEQKWIDKAQAQTEKLKELVNSLVTLSRMDEDETPLKFADFDISAALSETADSFNESAEAAGHRLITDIAPDIHYNGDEYAVRQLVSILLDNAVKYASPDSPITLKLERDRKGVVIRSSNGCDNVDAEDTKKLFDRFYRADKARGSGGFGIGLSIARSIAEAHKGSIKAELTDNNTIEFTVHLK